MKNKPIYSVGEMCKDIRKHIVRITQKEMSEITGINSSTLSAFENNRSTNMNILFEYLKLLSDEEGTEIIKQIIRIIEGL